MKNRIGAVLICIASLLVIVACFFFPSISSSAADAQALGKSEFAETSALSIESAQMSIIEKLLLMQESEEIPLSSGSNLTEKAVYDIGIQEASKLFPDIGIEFSFETAEFITESVLYFCPDEPDSSIIKWFVIFEDRFSNSFSVEIDDETGTLIGMSYSSETLFSSGKDFLTWKEITEKTVSELIAEKTGLAVANYSETPVESNYADDYAGDYYIVENRLILTDGSNYVKFKFNISSYGFAISLYR